MISNSSLHAQRLIGEALGPLAARGDHFAILAALEEFGPASQIAIGQRCGLDRSDTHVAVTELATRG